VVRRRLIRLEVSFVGARAGIDEEEANGVDVGADENITMDLR
jgi:hypothetical protein